MTSNRRSDPYRPHSKHGNASPTAGSRSKLMLPAITPPLAHDFCRDNMDELPRDLLEEHEFDERRRQDHLLIG